MSIFSNIKINSCYKNPLDSVRAISVEELRSDWSKELHESVVLSIVNNSQWNCYQTHPTVSLQF